MTLKKNLKTGQAALEYFILFAIIGVLTILTTTTLLPQIRNTAEDYSNRAMARIVGG